MAAKLPSRPALLVATAACFNALPKWIKINRQHTPPPHPPPIHPEPAGMHLEASCHLPGLLWAPRQHAHINSCPPKPIPNAVASTLTVCCGLTKKGSSSGQPHDEAAPGASLAAAPTGPRQWHSTAGHPVLPPDHCLHLNLQGFMLNFAGLEQN